MSESFGGRLRRQRERQHIALDTITEHTKIKRSLLEALERDDISHWPGGIFRRAYIRAYAHAIGLEPDVIVREFLHLYPDPAEVVTTVSDADVDREWTSSRPPMRLRYLLGSAIGSLSWRRAENGRQAETTFRAPLSARGVPAVDRVRQESDLAAAAELCTAFGRAGATDDLEPLLRDAANILDAVGLIVWVWDSRVAKLKPTLACGYSDQVLAQLPALERDADNATAAAFRLAQPCTVESRERTSGALVVPLMTAAGCTGVLAMELQNGGEQLRTVRAFATIFASQLARLTAARQAEETPGARIRNAYGR